MRNNINVIEEVYSGFNRFTTFKDKQWFVANFWTTATQELSDYVSEFPSEETYFVNFLREPIDPTGDEDEDVSLDAPKIYEELPSYVETYILSEYVCLCEDTYLIIYLQLGICA